MTQSKAGLFRFTQNQTKLVKGLVHFYQSDVKVKKQVKVKGYNKIQLNWECAREVFLLTYL